MPMQPDDLSRRFFLDVCAAGSVHIRESGHPMHRGMRLLPVFSVDTYDAAEMLRVEHCRLARDGSGTYYLNDPPKSVDDLGRVSDLFRASWQRHVTRNAQRAEEGLRDPKVRRAALDILDRAAKVAE